MRGFAALEEAITVTMALGSFPPPVVAPIPVVRIGPVAFRSYRSAKSGSRATVFVADDAPGMFTITGEFYPPAMLTAYRIGQVVLSFVAIAGLVAAMFAAAAAESDDGSPLAVLLLGIGVAAMVALVVWKVILVRSATPATLHVRAVDVQHVRSTVNYGLLAWWILIGPFALIPLFVGRRLLRMQVPVTVNSRVGLLPLVLLEQRRGDAQAVALGLRLAGAH
jgi:hypothetical protein